MQLIIYIKLIKLIVTFIYKFKYTICNNAFIKFLIIALNRCFLLLVFIYFNSNKIIKHCFLLSDA